MFSRSSLLSLAALSFLSASTVSAQTCESYGIDFQDGGSYFIDSNSNQSFTTVSEFSGCQNGTASVMLIDPDENGYECTDIATQPDYTPELSTCPILKDQMFSGEWIILILGNNDDSDSFAYQRNIDLTVAPQQTVTATPTATYSQTVTPTSTATSTSTVLTTDTISATTTITVPAKTRVVTVTPKSKTSTSWHTVTETIKKYKSTHVIIEKTATPSCSVPHRQSHPDPICNVWPKNIPLPPGFHLENKKRDTAASSSAIRARFNAIKAINKAKREAAEAVAHPVKRSADVATVTTTITSPIVNTTTTFTAAATTLYNVTITTETDYTTLPPSTVHTGTTKITVTAKTPTKTEWKVTSTKVTVTKTLTATIVRTTSVTPKAEATSCKKVGGSLVWPKKK